MVNPSDQPVPVLDYAPSEEKVYRCGTLTYTTLGLTTLFAWLLWGDFCFNMMENVVGPSLQLKLKGLGASDFWISAILTAVPSVFNTTVCPWVSFRSDRHRGRWGRRIPFMLSSMPFLVVSLLLLGWSQSIAGLLHRTVPALAVTSPATLVVVLIGVFTTFFQFFNLYVSSVYWYLFNDVVPPQFLGRFFGLFRIVSTLASMLYQYFIFEHAESHMGPILTGGALLYLFGFGAMCLFVKEGQYPPPPDETHRKSFREGVRAFVAQSFSHRFYWYFYLRDVFANIASVAGVFVLFFSQEMGLSLKQIGRLGAWGSLATLLATYTTAVFVDRWHPLRITTYMAVFAACTAMGSWVWIFITLPSDVFFWVSLGGTLVAVFGNTLLDGCTIPMFMRLMPKSLYGQLSSANAMLRSLARIPFAFVVGWLMDWIRRKCGGTDFAYRFNFIWPWFFNAISALFLVLGYREWKRLGGDERYRPPAPWRPEGFEEVIDTVPTVPPRPQLVMISMCLFLIGCIANILIVLAFIGAMTQRGQLHAVAWYLRIFIPLKAVLTLLSLWQLLSVRRDLRERQGGQRTRLGIPHHGVLLVNAIQGLVGFPVYWYQMIKMIELGLQPETIIFGIASLIGTVMVVMFVQIIRWIERDAEKPAERRVTIPA